MKAINRKKFKKVLIANRGGQVFAGIGADVGLGHWGSVRPRLVADVGFSFGNSGTIKTSNGSHDLEKYHYDPGFYLRAGLLFEF